MNTFAIIAGCWLLKIGIDIRNKILINQLKKLPKPTPLGTIDSKTVFESLKTITYKNCIIYQDGSRTANFSLNSYNILFKIDDTEKKKFDSLYPCQHYTESLLIALYAYMPGCIAGACNINTPTSNHRCIVFYAEGKWYIFEPQTDSAITKPSDWNIFEVYLLKEPLKARV